VTQVSNKTSGPQAQVKVQATNCDTNRKPEFDLILENNTNLHQRLPAIVQNCQIIAFYRGVPLVNAFALSHLFK